MIAAGIGCSRGAESAAVLAAVDAALAAHRLSRSRLSLLATDERKAEELGIVEAAEALAVPLHRFAKEALAAVEPLTRSERSLEATGVASLSEAAALAAAGPGARLLGPRLAVGPVTCALAESGERS